MAERGMAIEDEREQTVGLFTELNIHNHFDWVEINNWIPQHKSIEFVDTSNEQNGLYNTHKTPLKNKIRNKLRKATDKTYILYNSVFPSPT